MRWLIIIYLLVLVIQQKADLQEATAEPFQAPPSYRPYDCMKHDAQANLWFPCRDSVIPNGEA